MVINNYFLVKDEYKFRSIMLICIGIGAVASLLFHLLVTEEIQAVPQAVPQVGSGVVVFVVVVFNLLVAEEEKVVPHI